MLPSDGRKRNMWVDFLLGRALHSLHRVRRRVKPAATLLRRGAIPKKFGFRSRSHPQRGTPAADRRRSRNSLLPLAFVFLINFISSNFSSLGDGLAGFCSVARSFLTCFLRVSRLSSSSSLRFLNAVYQPGHLLQAWVFALVPLEIERPILSDFPGSSSPYGSVTRLLHFVLLSFPDIDSRDFGRAWVDPLWFPSKSRKKRSPERDNGGRVRSWPKRLHVADSDVVPSDSMRPG